jgi:Zn-dependent protease with chaperone function
VAAARRRRATPDDVLAVIAKPGPAADVRIIDCDQPAVYCLPGRRRIVLTTGALTWATLAIAAITLACVTIIRCPPAPYS